MSTPSDGSGSIARNTEDRAWVVYLRSLIGVLIAIPVILLVSSALSDSPTFWSAVAGMSPACWAVALGVYFGNSWLKFVLVFYGIMMWCMGYCAVSFAAIAPEAPASFIVASLVAGAALLPAISCPEMLYYRLRKPLGDLDDAALVRGRAQRRNRPLSAGGRRWIAYLRFLVVLFVLLTQVALVLSFLYADALFSAWRVVALSAVYAAFAVALYFGQWWAKVPISFFAVVSFVAFAEAYEQYGLRVVQDAPQHVVVALVGVYALALMACPHRYFRCVRNPGWLGSGRR